MLQHLFLRILRIDTQNAFGTTYSEALHHLYLLLSEVFVLNVVHDRSLGKDVSLDTVKTLSRDDLETDLTFVSLLLFRNELKPDTRNVIEDLREGEVCQCDFHYCE
jgi:magnesium-transporting ATPase (P-type)